MGQQSNQTQGLVGTKSAVFIMALLPLAKLLLNALQDNLGANPIEKITHVTGFWTLTFLLICLTATPLRKLSGWFWPIRVRRMLGLFVFFYACLHFLTYLILDQFFDWSAIWADIAKRPYITIGFTALVCLLPLAVTSNDKITRKIGGKNWRRLHSLIYPIAIAGVIHFIWLVKKDLTIPLIFAGILTVLLTARLILRR
ncbi:MAG: sulfoxide reductase heme-binding subunit YedZ [Methylomonas sp.]|nr:MAG: sulfoxide reductase heme-binding subunit YedZ [Methylomonas sp.]